MAKINLLPWREELRKERQQQFGVALFVSAIAAACVFGVIHFYHTQLIDYQQTRNKYLEEQIVLLDKKIAEIEQLEKEKERLLARMRAIEQLQSNRPLIVRLFDEMVKNLPDGVSLTQLTQQGGTITINGVAQSNARVSSFMRNLENSKWLKDPQLDVIQAKDEEGHRISNFTLRFSQKVPSAEGEESGA